MTKIWSDSNEIVTVQKTMTQVLGKHSITWLGGWRLQNRKWTMIFHYKNPSFLPVPISDYIHNRCFLAFFFHCVYLLNSITAISALAAWNSPTTQWHKLFTAPQVVTEGPNRARGTARQGQSETYSPPWQRASPFGELLNRFFIAACNLTHSCRMQLNRLSSSLIQASRWTA